MRFSSAEVDFYRINGYLPGPRVLDDDFLQRLRQRFNDILEGRTDYPSELRGVSPKDGPRRSNLNGVKMVNVFRHDPVFAEVLKLESIGALAQDLLEGPIRVWQDQAIMKVPHDETTGLAWHQDYVYNDQIGPPEWLTCWIALDDATVANGCMQIIPQSHRWSVVYSRDEVDPNDMDWLLRRPDIPSGSDLSPVPCEMKAGYCHFHHCRLFHGSYGNKTDNPRRSYIPILMPGNTVRTGSDWNPTRQASVSDIPIGGIVQGPDFPELVAPQRE